MEQVIKLYKLNVSNIQWWFFQFRLCSEPIMPPPLLVKTLAAIMMRDH